MPRHVSLSDSKCWNGGEKWVRVPVLHDMIPLPFIFKCVATLQPYNTIISQYVPVPRPPSRAGCHCHWHCHNSCSDRPISGCHHRWMVCSHPPTLPPPPQCQGYCRKTTTITQGVYTLIVSIFIYIYIITSERSERSSY